MRTAILLAVLLTGDFSFLALESADHRFAILPASTITINGKTNVKKFQCVIARYSGSDTLVLSQKIGDIAIFTRGMVKLNAAEFDCGLNVITKDFQSTIKAEQYPFITIGFVSFERTPLFQSKQDNFIGSMEITLAEVSHQFDITCSLYKDKNGQFHLEGSQDFTFSEFKMKAPSKMLGTIKVRDDILVSFHLVLVQL